MSFDTIVAEIKAGGINGIFGLDQLDWGGQSGAVYECWKVSPCCGEPDFGGAVMCCLNWYCCAPCASCKLFASSTGEDNCYIIPHCLAGWCCAPCTVIATRYNIRKRLNVPGNIIGDCMCLYCCGPCSVCQVLRSVRPEEWNVISPFVIPEMASPNPKPLLNTAAAAGTKGTETTPLASAV